MRIRRPILTPTAANAALHTNLQPQDLRSPYPHVVEAVRPRHNGARYTVVTNQGTWDFANTTRLVFPRRGNDDVLVARNWTAAGEKPTPEEICLGDIFEWDGIQWTVCTVRARNFQKNVIDIHLTSAGNVRPPLVRSVVLGQEFDVGVATKITEPRPAVKQNDVYALMRYCGPYVITEHILKPERVLWYYATHPFRRGRWPAIFNEGPIMITDRVFVSRPFDKFSTEWSEFTYFGPAWGRHPRDPQIDTAPDTEVPASFREQDDALRDWEDSVKDRS